MNLIEILSVCRKGKALTDAQEKLQELVKAARKTGKKGKLTIALEVEPDADGVIVITDDVTAKIPKPKVGQTSFYDDDDGGLHRDDPRQPEFPAITRIEEAKAANE